MLTKRAYLTEKGNFTIQEVDLKPKADEILIKVAICGLCNWELNFWKSNGGMYSEYPALLGHEWSGEVVEVGEAVTRFKVGDKVLLTKDEHDTLHGFKGDSSLDPTKPILIYKTNAIIAKVN